MSHALAIDLGGTKCSAAVIDRKGKIVTRRTAPVDVTSVSGPIFQLVQLALQPNEVLVGFAVIGQYRLAGSIPVEQVDMLANIKERKML